MNRPEPQISKAALDQLASYHWPGNVRELQNTVERAIILWREGPFIFDLPHSAIRRRYRRASEAHGKRSRYLREMN